MNRNTLGIYRRVALMNTHSVNRKSSSKSIAGACCAQRVRCTQINTHTPRSASNLETPVTFPGGVPKARPRCRPKALACGRCTRCCEVPPHTRRAPLLAPWLVKLPKHFVIDSKNHNICERDRHACRVLSGPVFKLLANVNSVNFSVVGLSCVCLRGKQVCKNLCLCRGSFSLLRLMVSHLCICRGLARTRCAQESRRRPQRTVCLFRRPAKVPENDRPWATCDIRAGAAREGE